VTAGPVAGGVVRVGLDGLSDACGASGRCVALSNLGAATREETHGYWNCEVV
jgi:hypothetical protein